MSLAVALVALASLALLALTVAVARLVAGDGLGHRPGPPSHHDVWCPGHARPSGDSSQGVWRAGACGGCRSSGGFR